MTIKVPPAKEVLQRIWIQWSCFTIIGLLFVFFHFIFHFTRHRGFYCDDQTLLHPYIENETVPMLMALAIWVFAVLATVIPTEVLVEKTRPDSSRQGIKLFGVFIPTLVLELYRVFAYLFVGGSFCMLFTDISKNTIGRLRPHFLTICDPWSNGFKGNCTVVRNHCRQGSGMMGEDEALSYEGSGAAPPRQQCTDILYRYTGDQMDDDVICGSLFKNKGNETLAKMLKEARLSFMSGHSSFSFFCAVFLILYLQIRVQSIDHSNPRTGRMSKTLVLLIRHTRLFWQFGLGILAFWIAMTRISDYFHHPMDVVTGSLVGIICASLTLYISGMSTKEYVFSVPEDPRMSVVGTASNLSASPESIESQETVISKC